MLPAIFVNFLIGLTALSLSSSVALHSTSLDKAFATTLNQESNTTLRDFSHITTNDLHVQSHQSVNDATASDPALATRSHSKHTALQHARFKLASLTA